MSRQATKPFLHSEGVLLFFVLPYGFWWSLSRISATQLKHEMEACPIRLFLRDGYFKTKIYKNREFYTNNIKNTVCASRLFHLRRPLAFIYMAMDTPSPTFPNKFRWIQYRSQSIEDGTNTPLLLVRWTIIERCCAKFLRRPTQGCWCRRQCQVLVS